MAILLKSLLNESHIKVKIADYNESDELKYLYDLQQVITRKVITPILKGKKMDGSHAPIMPDGPAFYDKKGNLNVYIGMFPPSIQPKILGGISYLLNYLGVETGKWKLMDEPNQHLLPHVIIPVLSLPTKQDVAPTIGMDAGHLEKIKELLGIQDDKDYELHGQSLSLHVTVDTLEILLDSYYEALQKGLAPQPPNSTIRNALSELKEMIKWANQHHFYAIEAF